jgi:hypothetical protein
MLERENSVVFLAASLDACALWRLFFPYLATPGSGFFCFRNSVDFTRITGYEVCVVQRCCTPQQFQFISTAAQLGMKVIYDLDDNIWDIPTYNPAHEPLAKFRDGFGQCIKAVDVVTVSTAALRNAVQKNIGRMVNGQGRTIPVVVAENRILERVFAIPARLDKLVIGWAGSSSHIGDLVLISRGLAQIAKEHSDIIVEYRGCVLPVGDPLWGVPNFRHRQWTPVTEFGGRMPLWGWGIALAPVIDNAFNASKSCIKMIEAGYCGIPCLASSVRPYQEFCAHDKDLAWLLCGSAIAFERKIRALVSDPIHRAYLGRKMKEVVTAYYTYGSRHEGWVEAVRLAKGA